MKIFINTIIDYKEHFLTSQGSRLLILALFQNSERQIGRNFKNFSAEEYEES
jgi:hypothetical protein